MKKTAEPSKTPAFCDAEALYLKAERYVQHMNSFDSDAWEYALWSSLSLELLARAALANVSPVLLAECDRNWSSLYHALGFTPKEEKFAPKSISIADVFRRLKAIFPDFTGEHESFGNLHTGRRNAELHSGELAFDGVKGSAWQPRFYETCKVLLKSMGMQLGDFIGKDDAKIAEQLIAAAADESAKSVRSDIHSHRKTWLAKIDVDRETMSAQAKLWARRQVGHRVECPACESQALVTGEPIGTPTQRLNDDEITETQEYLPNRFECIACGLKIGGLSRLTAAGLSDRYKKTQVFDAAEYYAPEDEYVGYEDDNNEY